MEYMQFCKLGIPSAISRFRSLTKWNTDQLAYLKFVIRTNSQANVKIAIIAIGIWLMCLPLKLIKFYLM